MKTIATKLDNDEFDEFLEICNEDGCTKSEKLRKLVKDFIQAENDNTDEETENKIIPKPRSQGTIIKVSYDDGKTWEDVHEIENPKIVES